MVNKGSGTPDADQDSSELEKEPEQAQRPEEAASATAEESASAEREGEDNIESEVQPRPAADEKDEDAEPAVKAVTVDPIRKKQRREPDPSQRKRRATSAEPLSEEEIDSPSKQTLGMLGVVAAATLVMWGVGRAKCNYHEVGEGMKPREVTFEERTRAPKEVAFEFQHALASYNLDTAAKLATGPAKELVEERRKTCAGGSCAKKHESLAGKVNSVAELLKRTPTHSVARAWSIGSDAAAEKHVLVLKRMGKDWKVESYAKGTGENVEVPGMTVGHPQDISGGQAPHGLPGAHPRAGAAPHPDYDHPAPNQEIPPARKDMPTPQAPAHPAPPAPEMPAPVNPAPPAPKAPAAIPTSDKPAPAVPRSTAPLPAQ